MKPLNHEESRSKLFELEHRRYVTDNHNERAKFAWLRRRARRRGLADRLRREGE